MQDFIYAVPVSEAARPLLLFCTYVSALTVIHALSVVYTLYVFGGERRECAKL